MKLKLLIGSSAIALLASFNARAADPPAPPPQKVCKYPDDAFVKLGIGNGEVATVGDLLRDADGVIPRRTKALVAAINVQLTELDAKYCK